MRVAVGSTNPVKIAAVRAAFGQLWPDAEIVGLDVPSGVSAMPMSAAECLAGARNRATAARERVNGAFGVGLEGGVERLNDALCLTGWVVVAHRDGREGVGSAARILLPDAIAARVLSGEELGHVMDDVVQAHNTKQKEGAVGILTANLVDRREAFGMAVACALAPFVSPELYG